MKDFSDRDKREHETTSAVGHYGEVAWNLALILLGLLAWWLVFS